MKPGPVLAMLGLLVASMALVLKPTLDRARYDAAVLVGTTEILLTLDEAGISIIEPSRLRTDEPLSDSRFSELLDAERQRWEAKSAFERTMLGFFNISGWANAVWVLVGLGGQAAFFGRMFIQWVVSEKRRQSQVPELFWWLSFLGGACLLTYFVWRVDVVGVLGQSTGVVIYARNLRLIQKQKRRDRRRASEQTGPDTDRPKGESDAGAA